MLMQFSYDKEQGDNVKRIRLPGTEHMDKAYHQKKYHVARSVIGMALGLIPCFLCGLIVMVIG